jgi:hypothetical protein
MKTEFIVMTAPAKMPANCKGRYGKVAVCEVARGVRPKMISERAKGMVRIVTLLNPLSMGWLDMRPPCVSDSPASKTAYARALRDATRLCRGLNLEARMNASAQHVD